MDLIVIWSSVLLKETNKVMIENERNDVTEGIVEAFVTINQVRTLVNVECPCHLHLRRKSRQTMNNTNL